MLWRLALLELRNQRRFAFFFLANLAVGLLGFVTLECLDASIDRALSTKAKELLAADLSIAVSRPLRDTEQNVLRDTLGKQAERSNIVDLFSMITGKSNSRLAQLRAADDAFPLYGKLVLASGATIHSGNAKALNSDKIAWIYPELAAQLDLKNGDMLKIGATTFRIADQILEDAGNTRGGPTLLPTVYIGKRFLAETALIQKGSTVTYRSLFKLSAPYDDLERLNRLATDLNTRLSDPGIRIQTHRTASDQLGRMLGYLNDYLGLASLVALFLSGIGATYLFHSLLNQRRKSIAILRALGLSLSQVQRIYIMQMALLGFGAALIALAGSIPLLPLALKLTRNLIAVELVGAVTYETILLTLLLGVTSGVVLCLPLLGGMRGLQPAALFQEGNGGEATGAARFLHFTPALLFYWGLAVWQANSWRVGSVFIVCLIGSATTVFYGGRVVLRLVRRFVTNALPLPLHLAALQLTRQRFRTLLCFTTLACATLLANIIPQLESSLLSELEAPGGGRTPSLFFFDIQEDQVTALQSLLQQKGHPLSNVSPMVHARLEKVNDVAFEKSNPIDDPQTREAQVESRFRNRSFNLSYRDGLSSDETLVAGPPIVGAFDPRTSKYPLISVEKRFAERLGLKLGDRLTFDVQGVPIDGVIANLRKVRWTSFQPNFFLQFQPGALEAAPKTFLASLSLPGGPHDIKVKTTLQNSVVTTFPNVSVIDVSRTVKQFGDIIRQMRWALQAMTLLTLLAGLAVLFSIAHYQGVQMRREMALLKTMGATLPDLRRLLDWQFGLLASAAAVVGAVGSCAMAYLLARLMFESVWKINVLIPLMTLPVVTIASLALARIACRSALRSKPLALLQASI